MQLAQNAAIKEYLRGKLERRANQSKVIIHKHYKNSQVDFIQALKKLKKIELLKNVGDGTRIIDYI
ncbi:MAG: hypothetical protein ACXAES_01790 [Promethearchaeota archaeon]